MKNKERLDVLLVNLGYYDSREKAKRAIMAGMVFIDNQRVDKPGTQIDLSADVHVKEDPCQYVSRGGLKLEKALQSFHFEIANKNAMDIGASTGGFTDCMLKNGANFVYAIDVGYGQLDWKLRNNEQVINMEKTNIRYVTKEQIDKPVHFISIDVSFISLTLVLSVAYNLLEESGELVCLIKPQFEAGREQVGKNGIVRDTKVHEQVIEKIVNFSHELGFSIKGLTFSPVKGAKGNIEYLLYLAKTSDEDVSIDIHQTIEDATKEL